LFQLSLSFKKQGGRFSDALFLLGRTASDKANGNGCNRLFQICLHHQSKDLQLLPGDTHEIVVVPNGVLPTSNRGRAVKTIDLLFTGNLSYPPNIEAAKFLCKEVLPLLGKNNYQLVIAGADPHRAVLALESAGIRIMPNVEEMTELQHSARLFIAPMFLSTGVQNKILEAMAAGLPVLTSPQAAAAIHAIPNQHLFTAVAAADFATQISSILSLSSTEIEKICSQAKMLTEQQFQWEKNVFLLESQSYNSTHSLFFQKQRSFN
jgi:glycosyltransferase involved in cell wall biosynthesis